MKKILVYSHDTYGLGNLRRMLAICLALHREIDDLSILLLSGSPMVQSFRLTDGLDYIKLPCLTRTEREGYAAKSLRTNLTETIQLRSELIRAAALNFRPDLFLVDKKPFGVKNELKATLDELKETNPAMKVALILRDILDAPEATINVWQGRDYYEGIESFYDLVLVMGQQEIFDPCREYEFPTEVAEKVRFCGYTRRDPGQKSRAEIRRELGLTEQEKLIVVTMGGGEDGYDAIATYLTGLATLPRDHNLRSLIIYGPEMKAPEREMLSTITEKQPRVTMMEFTDDLMSYLGAADAVISMGGYNTICEILSLQKKAIVIPRAYPVQEQLIRAERMSQRGYFKYIHPDELAARQLMETLLSELAADNPNYPGLRLDAHHQIAEWASSLLFPTPQQ